MQERTREEQEAMMDEQRDREENWRLVKDIHLKVCQLFALQQKEFEPVKVQELKREILTQLEKLSGDSASPAEGGADNK